MIRSSVRFRSVAPLMLSGLCESEEGRKSRRVQYLCNQEEQQRPPAFPVNVETSHPRRPAIIPGAALPPLSGSTTGQSPPASRADCQSLSAGRVPPLWPLAPGDRELYSFVLPTTDRSEVPLRAAALAGIPHKRLKLSGRRSGAKSDMELSKFLNYTVRQKSDSPRNIQPKSHSHEAINQLYCRSIDPCIPTCG